MLSAIRENEEELQEEQAPTMTDEQAEEYAKVCNMRLRFLCERLGKELKPQQPQQPQRQLREQEQEHRA